MNFLWIVVILLLLILAVIAIIYGKATTRYTSYADLVKAGDISEYKVKAGDLCYIKEVCPQGYYCSGTCVSGPYGELGQYCPCKEGLRCGINPAFIGVTGATGASEANTLVCLSSQCTKDSDCGALHCQDGRCTEFTANGASCQFNDDCRSGNCSYNFCQAQGVVSGRDQALCFPNFPDPQSGSEAKPGCGSQFSCLDNICQSKGLPLGSVCNLSKCQPGLLCLDGKENLCPLGATGATGTEICHCQYSGTNSCTSLKCAEFLQCVGNTCLGITGSPCQLNPQCVSGVCAAKPSILYYDTGNWYPSKNVWPGATASRLFTSNLSSEQAALFRPSFFAADAGNISFFSLDIRSDLNVWTFVAGSLGSVSVYPRSFPSNYLYSLNLRGGTASLIPLNAVKVIGTNPINPISIELANVVDGDISSDQNVVLQDSSNRFYSLVPLQVALCTSGLGCNAIPSLISGISGTKPRYYGAGFAYVDGPLVKFSSSSLSYTPPDINGNILDLSFSDPKTGIIAYYSGSEVKVVRILQGVFYKIQGYYSAATTVYCGPWKEVPDFTLISSGGVCS